jgi:hypothetical protein
MPMFALDKFLVFSNLEYLNSYDVFYFDFNN